MSRKKRKDKGTARLRREVEALRAQLKNAPGASMEKKEKTDAKPQTKAAAVADIRADLRKTAILTAVCLGILFILYLGL